MLRVNDISKAYLQRPIKPMYGWTQATPQGLLLDPAWDRSVPIWPGMVAMKTTGDLTTLINATGVPLGMFGVYIGGDGIDELLNAGINACPVWVMDPDAQFEILAPAFDDSLSWTEPGDGTIELVSAYVSGANRGKICPQGTTHSSRAFARLLRIDGPHQIVIGGLQTGDVGAATA